MAELEYCMNDESEGFTLLDVVEMIVAADARIRGDDPEIHAKNRAMTLGLEFAREARHAAKLKDGQLVEIDASKAIDSLSMLAAAAEQMLTLMYLSMGKSDRKAQLEFISDRASLMADSLLAGVQHFAGKTRQEIEGLIEDAVARRKELDQKEKIVDATEAIAKARRLN